MAVVTLSTAAFPLLLGKLVYNKSVARLPRTGLCVELRGWSVLALLAWYVRFSLGLLHGE